MGSSGKRVVVARLWKLVLALNESRFGRTAAQLQEALGISRSTLYRDLQMLEDARVGLARSNMNGETRIQLLGLKALPVTPTHLQVVALQLARETLTPLEGTAVLRELDDLLEQCEQAVDIGISVGRHSSSGERSTVVATMDSALRAGRRLVIEYQGAQDDTPHQREVDPLVLHLEHEQPYLFAYCHERRDYRLFKLARVHRAQQTQTPCGNHADVDLEERLAHSVKVWLSDAPTRVVVRIAPTKARFLNEYPLHPKQEVEPLPDGTALVRAEVNGTIEALRWVLSWGAHAAVVAPKELRDAVRDELIAASRHYAQGPINAPSSTIGEAREEGVSHSWDKGEAGWGR